MFIRQATNINSIFFGLIRPCSNPRSTTPRGEHTNHYTTDAVRHSCSINLLTMSIIWLSLWKIVRSSVILLLPLLIYWFLINLKFLELFIHFPIGSNFKTLSCYNLWFPSEWVSEWVSEWLLFNANSAIFQLHHGENRLIFNEMMMRSALY
jgi:hypothetical protein